MIATMASLLMFLFPFTTTSRTIGAPWADASFTSNKAANRVLVPLFKLKISSDEL
jgi:hypothetical protein